MNFKPFFSCSLKKNDAKIKLPDTFFSYDHISLVGSKNQFFIPRLSDQGGCVWQVEETQPLNYDNDNVPLCVQSIGQVWDVNYAWRERSPWVVNHWKEPLPLNQSDVVLPSVVDLPIKMPGSGEYRLPREFACLEKLLRYLSSIEHQINPRVNQDYHAYLTVDTREVKAGTTQRSPGAHVDGFQGDRIQPKVPVDHSFLLSTGLPTLFHQQPFEVSSLDPRHDDFFLEFQRQLDPRKTRTYPDQTILFIDPYVVHSAAVASVDCQRTFVRLSFSVRQFDRLGNGINPLFDYHWKMVSRDFRASISSVQLQLATPKS